MDEKIIIATKLKEFRKEQNLNQFEFAEDCGLSKETISLIEREKGNITLDTTQLLACRIGVTVSELLNNSAVTYFIVPGIIDVEGKTHNTYGIGAIRSGILEAEIRDISTNYNKIKNLVYLCNNENLSLVHLDDVIEDFLAE